MTGDPDVEAAEYVLGTLDARERSAFAERLGADSAVRAAVASWERRFADLADQVVPVEAPHHVWSAIEKAVLETEAKAPLMFRVIDGDRAASAATPDFRGSRNRWRALALFSGAVAASLLAFIGNRELYGPSEAPSGVTYIAAVNRGGDKPALLIRVNLKTGQVHVRPVSAQTPTGKSLELWYIGDNKPPTAMGLIREVPATLKIPPGASAKAATFAVSVEPPGGSRTGGPTGPVIYSGQLIREAD